jgi:hypothetical protein
MILSIDVIAESHQQGFAGLFSGKSSFLVLIAGFRACLREFTQFMAVSVDILGLVILTF